MAKSSTSSVLIAGAGFMGSAIAYLIATKTEAKIFLYDKFVDALRTADISIGRFANTAIEKNFLTKEEWQKAKKRILSVDNLNGVENCDLLIEAIAENLAIKKELFAYLDQKLPPHTVFASNTSSLPITALASATKRIDKFIGMHFFSPAHIMKLLEIIPSMDTSAETVSYIADFGKLLGKTVINSKDFPGFITSRLGMVLLNEAAFALMEGLSTAEEIDLGMTLGYNHPMGPLALADFIGLDICLSIMETLHNGFGDPKYRPCPLIRQLVSAGHLGRKTGKGFYNYGVA